MEIKEVISEAVITNKWAITTLEVVDLIEAEEEAIIEAEVEYTMEDKVDIIIIDLMAEIPVKITKQLNVSSLNKQDLANLETSAPLLTVMNS